MQNIRSKKENTKQQLKKVDTINKLTYCQSDLILTLNMCVCMCVYVYVYMSMRVCVLVCILFCMCIHEHRNIHKITLAIQTQIM